MKDIKFTVHGRSHTEGECNTCDKQQVCKHKAKMVEADMPIPCIFSFKCSRYKEE